TILQAPVSGDAQINVIPEKCMTTLDIRTIPGQNHLEIIQDIEEIFGKLKQEDHDFAASYEVIADRPATETAKGNPVVQAVYQAVESVLNEKPQYNGVPGATDGTYLHIHGVPIVTIGAGDRDIPHQIDEYVDVEALGETTALYRQAALNFLKD